VAAGLGLTPKQLRALRSKGYVEGEEPTTWDVATRCLQQSIGINIVHTEFPALSFASVKEALEYVRETYRDEVQTAILFARVKNQALALAMWAREQLPAMAPPYMVHAFPGREHCVIVQTDAEQLVRGITTPPDWNEVIHGS
jgi:uncharacterized protein (DUF433 family)